MSYYKILGIKSNATDNEIKKAFRKINLEFHPDKLVGKSEDFKKNCSDQLIKVREAHSILFDPVTRKIYDIDGEPGLELYKQKQDGEAQINEARERNQTGREERKQRLEEKKRKEAEELKRKELEEAERKKRKEEEEVERKKLEELQKKANNQKDAEDRQMKMAIQRQQEIELKAQEEIAIDIEKVRKQEEINLRIKNKNICFQKYLNELFFPFKNLILKIDNIDILDIETYIISHIINKSTDIIINLPDSNIKKLYLKLKEFKDYYDYEFNDEMTKKNIRGKILLKRFLNLCLEYSMDNYVVEKYEEFLKNKKKYDSDDFLFLEQIVGVYLKIIEGVIPNVHFL